MMSVFAEDTEQLIKEFVILLRTTKDDGAEMHRVMEFLSIVLKFKSSTPPTAEFITVLKHQKPVLFYFLKKSIAPASPLHFIIQLDMDYELALQRLGLAK